MKRHDQARFEVSVRVERGTKSASSTAETAKQLAVATEALLVSMFVAGDEIEYANALFSSVEDALTAVRVVHG